MDILIDSDRKIDAFHLSLVCDAVRSVLEIEGLTGEGEVSILFVDDEEIRRLNDEYRGINEVTDVLSFPQFETIEDIRSQVYSVLGDVVINLDRCKEQASLFGHSLQREIAYLTIHSMYHLLGYDHMDPVEKAQMRQKEERAFALIKGAE